MAQKTVRVPERSPSSNKASPALVPPQLPGFTDARTVPTQWHVSPEAARQSRVQLLAALRQGNTPARARGGDWVTNRV